MIDFFNNVAAFLQKKKTLLIPLVPFFFLILFVLFIFTFYFAPSSPQQDNIPNPTVMIQRSPTQIPLSPIPTIARFGTDADADLRNISLYEKNENLQQKETLSDGTIRYTLASPVADRPNIIFINPQTDVVLFQRTVSPPNSNTLLPQYIDLYGQPQRIITGSKFYGQTAQTYIFADNGVAVIANPQTNTIFEVHYFLSSSVDEYIKNYGDDLLTPTP